MSTAIDTIDDDSVVDFSVPSSSYETPTHEGEEIVVPLTYRDLRIVLGTIAAGKGYAGYHFHLNPTDRGEMDTLVPVLAEATSDVAARGKMISVEHRDMIMRVFAIMRVPQK